MSGLPATAVKLLLALGRGTCAITPSGISPARSSSASDALRAGVPLLTVQGGTFQSRVGASLARSLGLAELVVADTATMEEQAVALLAAPDRLRQLRAGLAARLPQSALFDPAGFARELEDLYARLAGRA